MSFGLWDRAVARLVFFFLLIPQEIYCDSSSKVLASGRE